MRVFTSSKGFDLVSPYYDFFKTLVFKDKLDQTQTCLLDHFPLHGKQLIIGGGTGKYLLSVLKHQNIDEIYYVDISPMMLKKAQKLIHKKAPQLEHKVRFIEESINHYNSHDKFDGIHTPFVLDCLDEDQLDKAIEKIRSLLNSEGLLYFSDFYTDNKSSFTQKKLINFLYWGFNFFIDSKRNDLPNFKALFLQYGFLLKKEKLLFNRSTQSSIWSL